MPSDNSARKTGLAYAEHRRGGVPDHAEVRRRTTISSSLGGTLFCALSLLLAVGVGATRTLADSPADQSLTTSLISPSSAWTYYGAATSHTVGAAAFASSPPEIKALARSLGGYGRLSTDQFAQNVASWVRNNVETEFRFGLSKGGRGALIEESGTPFDAAELMVKVLREGGATASYQVGTITLTDQEFGLWSGLVTSVTPATSTTPQSFTVNAKAACQFLADGAIPASVNGASSCSGLSGNLSTITMGHIWVSVNGKLYDPSFKHHVFKTGVDLAAAMSCGTAASPTCGSGVVTAVGGTLGTYAPSVPSLQGFSASAGFTQLTTDAQHLQATIEATTPAAKLDEIIGGKEVDASFAPVGGSGLPYASSAPSLQYTWSGDVPDQFRTTLQLQYVESSLYGSTTRQVGQLFYADESSTRRIRVSADCANSLYLASGGTPVLRLTVDAIVLQSTTSNCATGSGSDGFSMTQGTATLTATHPYASSGYGAITIVSTINAPFTVVQGWGDSAPSLAAFTADRSAYLGDDSSSPDCNGGPAGGFAHAAYCGDRGQSATAAMLLTQRTAARTLVGNILKTSITQHHTLGFVTAPAGSQLAYIGPESYELDVRSAASFDSRSATAADGVNAFEVTTVLSASLEGSVGMQSVDSFTSVSAVTSLAAPPSSTLLDIPSSQVAAVESGLSSQSLIDAMGGATSGQEFIVGNPAGIAGNAAVQGALGIGSGRLGYVSLTNGGLLRKGGGTMGSVADPSSAALKTIRQSEESARKKSYFSVDLATGGLTLTPTPDLVAGSGSFPYSLPFQRYYQSAGGVNETPFFVMTPNGYAGQESLHAYQGPDRDAFAHMGGGWFHNYEITAAINSDGLRGLGRMTALDASASIAGVYVLSNLLNGPSLPQRASSFITATWLTQQLANNAITITRPPSSEEFVVLPSGRFNPPAGSSDTVTQTGARLMLPFIVGSATLAWDYSPITLTFKDSSGGVIIFDEASFVGVGQPNSTQAQAAIKPGYVGEPKFKANSWTFPDGLALQFTYFQSTFTFQTGPYPNNVNFSRSVLSSVSNSLGRSLTLGFSECPSCNYAIYNGGTLVGYDGNNYGPVDGWHITSVTADDATRTASFALSNCPTAVVGGVTESSAGFDCNTFSVTAPDATVTKYDYAAGTDSPDPAAPSKPTYHLRRWFTPLAPTVPYQVFAYDDAYRMASATDPLTHTTQYFAGGFADEWMKHAQVVDPIGNLSESYFDAWNQNVVSIDALGRASAKAYDNARHEILSANPLLDCVATSRDVRGNEIATARYPAGSCQLVGQVVSPRTTSPGAPLTVFASPTGAPLTTAATFGEGPTVLVCSNLAFCNKPTSQTDPLGHVTNYGWDTGTGLLTQVLKPADGAGTRPQIDLGYTGYTANGATFSLLTSKTEKQTSTVSTTTTYTYDPTNKFELSTAIVDSGVLALRTCFKFDSAGRLTSTSDPRTVTCP